MTNKLYQRLAALVVLMLFTVSLAACGDATATPTSSGTSTTAASGTATTAAATAAATTAVTTTAAMTTAATTTTAASGSTGTTAKVMGKLTVWHSYSSGGAGEVDAFNQGLKLFQADNPDAQVEVLDIPFDQLFNKFKTESATGGGPDLFIGPNDSLGDLARAGLLMNLDGKVPGLDNDTQVSVDGSKVDGKLYQVPESLKALAMYYNKDKVKTVPQTTADMLTAQKAGTKFGFNTAAGAYYMFGFFGAYGGQLFDSTGKCIADQGGYADAFQFLKDMKTAGAQYYSDGDKFDQTFQSGNLDAVVEGPWKLADFKKSLGDKLGVAPIPAGPKGPASPMTGVDGWNINVNTKNLDGAIGFATYMTSPKVEQIFVDSAGHIPANKNVQVNDAFSKQFAQAVATGYPRPQNPELSAYWDNMNNAVNKLVDAGGDPKSLVADFAKAVNTANKK